MTITRINEFTAADGKEAELFEFLQELTVYISNSPGNVSCEVLKNQQNASHIVVIEKWLDEAAHKQSLANYPAEKMQVAMSLIGLPPKGEYFL